MLISQFYRLQEFYNKLLKLKDENTIIQSAVQQNLFYL